MGAPSLMLWLVISSLVIGLSHVPTGAAFAAIVIFSVPLRGGVATGEKGDLQIINHALTARTAALKPICINMSCKTAAMSKIHD